MQLFLRSRLRFVPTATHVRKMRSVTLSGSGRPSATNKSRAPASLSGLGCRSRLAALALHGCGAARRVAPPVEGRLAVLQQVQLDQFLFQILFGRASQGLHDLAQQQIGEAVACPVQSLTHARGADRLAQPSRELLGQLGGAKVRSIDPQAQHRVEGLAGLGPDPGQRLPGPG